MDEDVIQKMKAKIIPTVFAKSKQDFDHRFNKMLTLSNEIQIDFLF